MLRVLFFVFGLDRTKNMKECRRLSISQCPCIVFLTSDGLREIKRLSGFYSPELLAKEIKLVLNKN